MNKVSKLNIFSNIVLREEMLKGHLKWTVSLVAKEADVSRAWAYKNFGPDKNEILYQSLNTALDDFLCLSEERMELLKNEGATAVFLRSRELLTETPEIISFYLKYFFSDCRFGELIRSKENYYVRHGLTNRRNLKNRFQANFLRSLQHGTVLAFFLNPEETNELIDFSVSEKFLDWLRQMPLEE